MLIIDQLKKSDSTLQCVAFIVLLGMGTLLGGLWYVQVVKTARYRANLQDQAVRTVRVPAIRGKILDRNRVPLAENRPVFNVNLYLEDLRQNFQFEYTNQVRKEFKRNHPNTRLSRKIVEELGQQARYRVVSNILLQASSAIQEPRILREINFHTHYDQLRYLPLPLLRDLTKPQVAMFVEKAANLPSLALETQALRSYPFKSSAAHILGYLEKDTEPDEGEEFSFKYRLPDFSGIKGLEAAFDSELRGKAGVKLVLVNSTMYRQSEEILYPTEPGQNVVLTLDRTIQQAAEQGMANMASKLGRELRGAAVVLDVQTGDIYALASAPSFDPNKFVTGFTSEEWENAKMNDPVANPLFNRATYGRYPPGSSFKIIVALAALEAGTLDPEMVYTNNPPLMIGRHPFHDTAPKGLYNFRRAFYRSSNCYFIEQGLNLGSEKIIQMARRFHLGERTGLWPKMEDSGALPFPAEHKKLDGSPWMRGDTANLSIGHGEILVTPLQMAVMTAAVANGGKILQPRLVMQIEPQNPSDDSKIRRFPDRQIRDEVKLSPKNLDLVREAMLADVEEIRDLGGGRSARIPGYLIAGKTGTAKLKPGYSITWFVSFAPFENPRYAVAVVIEGGVSGGETCAPIAKEIYKGIISRDAAVLRKDQHIAFGLESRSLEASLEKPNRHIALLNP